MSENSLLVKNNKITSDWITIKEAVRFFNKKNNKKIKESDIYRNALQGKVCLSIYFQSPIVLRRIKSKNEKPTLIQIKNFSIQKLCLLDKNALKSGNDFIFSTEGEYFLPLQRIIDTKLLGHEFVLVQKLLASSLKLPAPITGANKNNYGITVNLFGQTFQVFERITWQERIKKQVKNLSLEYPTDIDKMVSLHSAIEKKRKGYFPLYELPKDACLVIRYKELENLSTYTLEENSTQALPSRISSPLSRLFWLACKHNDTISPLIRQPYKLLSIFEQWAVEEGITDHFSGDTLKSALQRGEPPSTSLHG
ncbi:hypothetical protein [Enterobacter mori]|uniref:hypothetical protein n=1 Tax=Enterobacter mori TaxID=539813 RepID=UPI001CF64DC2|nr:hypothetical protein [Enterobacter mori]UCT05955.1 hypothetical protein K6742_14330 [Enterobacter mori]